MQPAVHVRVPQVGPLLAELAEVGEVDAELGADALIGDRGRPVSPGRGGHPVSGHLLDGAADHQVALMGTDRGRRGDNIQAAGTLVAQHRDHVRQRGDVAGRVGNSKAVMTNSISTGRWVCWRPTHGQAAPRLGPGWRRAAGRDGQRPGCRAVGECPVRQPRTARHPGRHRLRARRLRFRRERRRPGWSHRRRSARRRCLRLRRKRRRRPGGCCVRAMVAVDRLGRDVARARRKRRPPRPAQSRSAGSRCWPGTPGTGPRPGEAGTVTVSPPGAAGCFGAEHRALVRGDDRGEHQQRQPDRQARVRTRRRPGRVQPGDIGEHRAGGRGGQAEAQRLGHGQQLPRDEPGHLPRGAARRAANSCGIDRRPTLTRLPPTMPCSPRSPAHGPPDPAASSPAGVRPASTAASPGPRPRRHSRRRGGAAERSAPYVRARPGPAQ